MVRPFDSSAAEPLRELSHHLVGLAVRAATVEAAGVSVVQLRTLEELARVTTSNSRTLAERVGTPSSTMSRICDRLLAGGLISREQNPLNRREVVVRLTPEGLAVLSRVRQHNDEDLVAILAQLPPQVRRTTIEAIRALVAVTEEGHSEGSARR